MRDTLALYLLSPADAHGIANLRFFALEAILNDTRCDFLILIPRSEHSDVLRSVPALPTHARYLLHESSCSAQWGLLGWALDQPDTLPRPVTTYAHVFTFDSSVIGPFIPPMLAPLVPWWQPLLSLLPSSPDALALVGSTISCEDAPGGDSTSGAEPQPQPPHVQLHAAAMTQATLAFLLAQGVFACQPDLSDGDTDDDPPSLPRSPDPTELAASAAVLRAGGTLDSLMGRYRYAGVDWRDARAWACNARLDPHPEFAHDGLTLAPYEALFVRSDALLLQQRHPAAEAAARCGQWRHGGSGVGSGDSDSGGDSGGTAAEANATRNLLLQRVLSNQFLLDTPHFKLPKILERLTHGPRCFDFYFFVRRNAELIAQRDLRGASEEELWEYFVYYGQFGPWEFRFTCPMDYEQFAGFSLKLHQRRLAQAGGEQRRTPADGT